MKKVIVFAIAIMFGITAPVFAQSILSDADLGVVSVGEINAGDWVTLSEAPTADQQAASMDAVSVPVNDSEPSEEPSDDYVVNNTLDLLNDSQRDIQAVSNVNSVDAGASVQSNVGRMSSDEIGRVEVDFTQENVADVTYSRPQDKASFADKAVFTYTDSKSLDVDASHSSASNSSSAASKSGGMSASSSLTEVLTIDGDANASSSFAMTSQGLDKGSISQFAGSGSAAYLETLDVDYNKAASSGASMNCAEASNSSSASNSSCALKIAAKADKATTCSKESNRTCSKAAKANNHLVLLNQSQQAIQAVANVNSVASAVAVQSNLVSDIGVGGSIAQSNAATVVSGI